MPKVKDSKTGKVKHFRYDKEGLMAAKKLKKKQKTARYS